MLPQPWTWLDEVWLCFLSTSDRFKYVSWAAREQIWINESFQYQLSLFELCRYAPSTDEGIYVRWRQNLDRQRQGRS